MMKNTFEFYGLDVENNLLQAPICQCGCGSYAHLVLKDDDDVFCFMYMMLEEEECGHCGIFSFKGDGEYMLIGLKLDGEIQCYTAKNTGNVKGSLNGIQDELELHCYGILEQVDDESYRIVMD